MYSLFIDTLSAPAYICLFDENKEIIDHMSWEGRHTEFDSLIESIDILLWRNTLDYPEIDTITCIIWPGGFTGIRVTTLVVNTLSYSFWIPLYPVTVKDFFYHQSASFPCILPLTKSEVILWEKYDADLLIIKTALLNVSKTYSTNQIISPENIQWTLQANNYKVFLKNFPFSQSVSLLHPLYARDPNILVK